MSYLPWLNYHHLLYFRTIVQEGGVTRAAKKLGLSQSTLSAQLRALEDAFETKLFSRERRQLVLTDSGRMALEFAEDIFQRGDELRALLAAGKGTTAEVVRIGALSPLSKNLQYQLIQPCILAGSPKIRVIEGDYAELLENLRCHQIDLLISNLPPGGIATDGTHAHLLGELPVYIVGRPPFRMSKDPFPHWLEGVPLFLPSTRTSARADFDAMLVREGVTPLVQAEVDDMALLRLLALSGAGLALVPEVSVRFDLEERKLLRIERVPDIYESYYAITAERKTLPEAILDIIEQGKASLSKKLTVPKSKPKTKSRRKPAR